MWRVGGIGGRLVLLVLSGGGSSPGTDAIAVPTARQLAWQSFSADGQMPLRTFHHFDICTFTGCEHNSGTAKKSQGSGAAAAFAPTATINATQWVLAAKALGAGSAVMTARHEGGFALWPSKYTNYSIAHSPYMGGKGDIVMEFVTACRAHGLKAGLYIAASCDAYHHCGPEGNSTPSDYERRQVGMVEELVSGTYGHIEYLWFDHHGNPVNSTSPFGPWCPHMCDPMSPKLWAAIDDTVQKFSRGTTLRGGADLNIGATDPPKGDGALWMSCNTTDATIHTRPAGAFGPFGQYYRPSEITNMLTTAGWFHHPSTKPKPTAEVLAMIWGSVAKGYSFIGNVPPNQAGVLDDSSVAMMHSVGRSIRGFWAASVGNASGACTAGEDTVTLSFSHAVGGGISGSSIKTIALRENLTAGQKVLRYVLEAQAAAATTPGNSSSTRGPGVAQQEQQQWIAVAGASSSTRQTIGNLFLHRDLKLASAGLVSKLRVRCVGIAGGGQSATVSLNALQLDPLEA